ncbi:hypothetical protein THASP1DRAFT_4481, partial [Thamnocephalis sphaerospora]
SNSIRTSRYNAFNFFPRQIVAQFSKVANLYFVFISALQLVPGWSPTGRYTTVLPLAIFVTIAMAHEAYDDFRRHRADKVENERQCEILRVYRSQSSDDSVVPVSTSEDAIATPGLVATDMSACVWQRIRWRQLAVGDVVRLCDGDWVPADLLLLHAPLGDGHCYVETAALDGETNLKEVHTPKILHGRANTAEQTADLRGKLRCVQAEDPNDDLYDFNGCLQLLPSKPVLDGEPRASFAAVAPVDERASLGIRNLLLRGTVLRNTPFIYGMVVYAGENTKIRQNALKNARTKAPMLQRQMNRAVISVFVLLLVLASVMTALQSQWLHRRRPRYLPKEDGAKGVASVFFSFIVLFNTIIPISLYVTMELVKVAQAYLIGQDLEMYDPASDTPAEARTSAINEDLGQVQYVFTDKTGTLTENVMEFRACSVAGIAYRGGEVHAPAASASTTSNVGGTGASRDEANTGCIIPVPTATPAVLSAKAAMVTESEEWWFLRALGVCHSVVPITKTDPATGKEISMDYQSTSPDEHALVGGARDFGFELRERHDDRMRLRIRRVGPRDTHEEYQVLDELPFSSRRKRMSVIVRMPNGRLALFCKGADSVLIDLLAYPSKEQAVSPTKADGKDNRVSAGDGLPPFDAGAARRTLKHLEKFAEVGLRTLVYAYRYLDEDEYAVWHAKYAHAQAAISNRIQRMEEVMEEMERSGRNGAGLRMCGVTAVEDRLQPGVPETIVALRRANIRVFMLTGDKLETAVNIGRSCSLIAPGSHIFTIRGEQAEAESSGGNAALATLPLRRADSLACNTGYSLVIDGAALALCRDSPGAVSALVELGTVCDAIICCRVSPCQKAMVVQLMRQRHPRAVTLAIGDGGNDIAMIQEAHLGIGITGREGLQAARASDYSIARFRFLQRLLFVHGRWSYVRVCKFTFGTFYKCIAFYLTQAGFQAFTGYSGTSLYEQWTLSLYNTIFSVLPVLIIGITEQDLSAATLMRVPELYRLGQKEVMFNLRRFWSCMLHGALQSLVLLVIPFIVHGGLTGSMSRYDSPQLFQVGLVVYTSVVLTVNFKVALLDAHYWSWVTAVGIILEAGAWFLFQLVYSVTYPVGGSAMGYDVHGQFISAAGRFDFWAMVVLSCTIALLPEISVRAFQNSWRPTDVSAFQQLEK